VVVVVEFTKISDRYHFGLSLPTNPWLASMETKAMMSLCVGVNSYYSLFSAIPFIIHFMDTIGWVI